MKRKPNDGQQLKRSTSRPRAGSRRTKVADAGPGVQSDVGPEKERDRAHRWSITYPTRESLFKDEPSERRPGTLEEFHPAALEQFEAARSAAMKILDTGVVGEAQCLVIISGHANKHHLPTNGQPNDAVSIVLRQVAS